MGAHAERMKQYDRGHSFRGSSGSSSRGSFTVDTSEVMGLFADLMGKEQEKATRDGLRKGANILRRATRRNLQSKIHGSIRKKWIGRDGKQYKSMSEGVVVNAKSAQEVRVHIMGEFRLKWFELGTESRSRKFWSAKRGIRFKDAEAGRTGKITGIHFFREAQQQTERQIFSNLDSYISQSIDKIARKHATKH